MEKMIDAVFKTMTAVMFTAIAFHIFNDRKQFAVCGPVQYVRTLKPYMEDKVVIFKIEDGSARCFQVGPAEIITKPEE